MRHPKYTVVFKGDNLRPRQAFSMKADSRFKHGFGVYVPSDAEDRAAWTGETIQQAQAAIDRERNVNSVKIRTDVNTVNIVTPKAG